MAMHNIPFDVLEIIVALCDSNGDLLTLSQANRTLQDLAERRLYKNIGALDVSRMCRVLHSVVHSTLPRGTFILDFGVHDSYFNATNPGCQLLGGFYRLLGQALRRMSNLRSLYLHLHPSQAWVINSCTTKLSMIVTNIPAGHLLASWLENQDHLVTFLHADRTPHPTPREFTVSPNAASHLRFIGARGGVLERLVPGRPVICAYLDYTDDFIRGVEDDEERVDYRDVMDALDASAGPLHTLSVHFRPFTEENAQSLVPFFKIESFNLSCVRTFDLHWPNNADYIMDIVPFITPLLPNFPQLQAIQIAASAHINEDFYDSTDNIANLWRGRAPSLKRVTLRDMNRWTKDSPTTGLLQFRVEGTDMMLETISRSIEEVELLKNNMSKFPIQYLEEDVPFCFEQYAGTWRSAFIMMD